MHFSKVFFALAASLFAASQSGCLVIASEPYVGRGSMTMSFTIDSSNHASECVYYGADQLEVTLFDAAGAPVITVDAPCEGHDLSVELDEGEYSAEATLIDLDGFPVSDTLVLDAFRVIDQTDLVIDLDFPADAMR